MSRLLKNLSDHYLIIARDFGNAGAPAHPTAAARPKPVTMPVQRSVDSPYGRRAVEPYGRVERWEITAGIAHTMPLFYPR